MSQDRRRGCTSRVSSSKRRVLRSRFSYIYDNGDAFVEAASSVKTRVSYTSFDRRLLFVPASPMYTYQRSRCLVIPVSYSFVERRRCLTARVSYAFRLGQGIHFLFTSARRRSRSQAGRPLTPEPPALVGSCARVAGRPASPPLAGLAQTSSHTHGQPPATGMPLPPAGGEL